MKNKRVCIICKVSNPDKGRAFDGRRAYRCKCCGNTWTEGMQGRTRRYSKQRMGDQFHDTGASTYASLQICLLDLREDYGR